MDAFVVLGLLIGLAVVAAGWGSDTRPRLDSKEWEQAQWGMSWGDRWVAPGPHVRPERSALAITRRARQAARPRYEVA